MKLKSELYVQELNLLMYGLTLQMEKCHEVILEQKRRTQISAFFAPWAKKQIWMSFSVNSNMILEYVESLSQLRDKILEAEGVDDDMQAVTYAQIIEKS